MNDLSTILSAELLNSNSTEFGKQNIKVFGAHDTRAQLLRARVMLALDATGIDGTVSEVSDPVAIQTAGVRALPALMSGGTILCEGMVPSVDGIVDLLRNQHLFKSKLFRMRTVSVPVDMSPVAANALRFAWRMAQQLGANVEAVFAMDSIFQGSTPSASGFLSSYQTTMKTELDTFVSQSLSTIGVNYAPPSKFAGTPGPNNEHQSFISSKVIYGAPDLALSDYSRQADIMVMGSTGRGGIGKKLFGSVSIEVSKNSHCPVIFVPQESEYRGFQQILYASDFDSLNALSVRQAVAFAKRFDGQMHFVHVGAGGEKGLENQRQIFESEYGEANAERPFIFSKMVSEDVAGALYEYSFYHRIDLLIFVTHQRTFWDNILHKSITNAALLSSDLPVLVMHSDDDMV